MRRILTTGWILCALVALPAPAEEPARPTSFAITGARIAPVSGPVLEKATITFRDGLITALGAEVSPPADAWVIAGEGLTVYPGLIDAFSAVGTPRLKEAEASNQPYSTGPDDRPAMYAGRLTAAEIDPADERVEKWRAAGFTTVVAAPRDGYFAGQAAIVNLGGDGRSEMVVEPRAALVISLDEQRGQRGFPASLMGRIAYVRQTFLDAEHLLRAEAIYGEHPKGLERPAYDAALAPLAEAVKAGLPALYPGQSARELERVAALAGEMPVRLIAYGGQEGYRVAGTLADAGVPVVIDAKWPEKAKNGDPEREESLQALRIRDRAATTPGVFAERGVKFAFSSGSAAKVDEFLGGVRKAIEKGLKAEDALAAMTLGAAEIYGAADRLGSLEPGKIANLVVTGGDIFDKETRVKMVFVDGKKFEIPERKPEDKKKDENPEPER